MDYNFIIILLLILLIPSVYNKDYKWLWIRKSKNYILPIVIILWFSFIVAYFLVSDDRRKVTSFWNVTDLVLYSFFVYNSITMFYLRLLIKNNNLFIALFLPLTYVFISFLLILNQPKYDGGMEAFGLILEAFFASLTFFFYPLLVLSVSLLKFDSKIKGLLLIIISIVSGILGVCQTVGSEGFLSDSSGEYFAITVCSLFLIGLYWFNKSKFKIETSKNIKTKL